LFGKKRYNAIMSQCYNVNFIPTLSHYRIVALIETQIYIIGSGNL